MLIDTHAHIQEFSDDEIRHIQKSMYVINIACSIEEIERTVDISEKFKNIKYSLGLHPELITNTISYEEIDNMISEFKKLVNKHMPIAIGEIGYNFGKTEDNTLEKQTYLFEKLLSFSTSLKLPAIIHCRENWKELLATFSRLNSSSGGVIHSIDTDKLNLTKLLDLGFYVSLNGISTFKSANSIRGLIKFIPLDRLLIETDSPFLSPEPVRGKQNTPLNIDYIYSFLANEFNITKEKLINTVLINSENLFKFPKNTF